MINYNRTWAEVDLSALKDNYQTVRDKVGSEVRIMAVVKADAYGHGVGEVAPLFEKLGADFFAVSCLQEAMELRSFGIRKPILILGYTDPEYYDHLLKYDLSQTVYDLKDAEAFSRVCTMHGETGKIHAALDTGMGRIGLDAFDPEIAAETASRMAKLPGVDLEGLFTHFSVADTKGEEAYTEEQFRRFCAVRDLLAAKGIHPLCHVANSAGIFLDPKYHLDMVRAGIVLYGLEPGGAESPFCPAMVLKTSVSMVKEVPAGRSISYGRRYQTASPRRIATLTAGYADGFPRALSQNGSVIIRGKSAPILGNVCMDQMMVDVTEIDCEVGDEAILMGGPLPFHTLATRLGTIHYELICGIGKRVPRIYR